MRIAAQIKLKHGRLWRILQKHGVSQAAFAKLCGYRYSTTIGKVINLHQRPSLAMAARIQDGCAKLGEYLDILDEWPEAFDGLGDTTATVFADIPEGQLLAAKQEPSLHNRKQLLERAMADALDAREAAVIEARFLRGQTLEIISDQIRCTRANVRRIEGNALRKLRYYCMEHDWPMANNRTQTRKRSNDNNIEA